MSDQDQTIACKDCRVDFVFTAGEAQFYADKGFQIPRRCKSCRALKKAQDQESEKVRAFIQTQQPATPAQPRPAPAQPRGGQPAPQAPQGLAPGLPQGTR